MANPKSHEKMFRLSLRELLVLVSMVALALASLKYATDAWVTLISAMTMIAFFIALIVAVVDRGRKQAFAIGFALVLVGYGAIVINGPRGANGLIQLDLSSGRLPTTQLLRYLHRAMRETHWIDPNTGERIPGYVPPRTQSRGFGTRGPYLSNVPSQDDFMPIGHCWFVLLLGYLGGRFAQFIYFRRQSEHRPLAAESS